MKILQLGVGRWGVNHLRVLLSAAIELFVVDVDAERLNYARKRGIDDAHLSTDPAAFVSRTDAAVLVTPAWNHYELCRELLEAGKDVFVEKPLTLYAKDARALARLAEDRGRILQVGHIFRFDPASQWLRDAIHQNAFGRLKMLRGRFSGFKRPRPDSGISLADGIHFVDLFNFLLDGLPKRVLAIHKDFLGRGVEDEALISLDYVREDKPVWASIECGCHLPGKVRQLTVVGEELSAICDFNAPQYKLTTYQNRHVLREGEVHAEEGAVRRLEFAPEEPLQSELRAFLQSIQTRQPPLADAWAGYQSVRVLEVAFQSARMGQPLELNQE